MQTSILRRPVVKWALPSGVAAVAVAAAAVGPVIAGADSELPERSATELLVELAGARDVAFSGTVVQSADLGLPEIPGTGAADAGSASTTALSLLTGSTSARIWYSDTENFRVALQDELAETDFIRNGQDVWFWNSQHESATHTTVSTKDSEQKMTLPENAPMGTPGAAAAMALQAIAPTTDVAVDGTATVAGRDAYELVVSPKDDKSLIGSIRLAVDGEHGLPLRVRILSSEGGDPVFEMGFTSVTFGEPDESVYDFNPPAGTEVEEVDPQELKRQSPHGPNGHGNANAEDVPAPSDVSVVGSGWTSVAVVRDVRLEDLTKSMDGKAPTVDALLGEFEKVSGPYGTGRAMSNDIVSALLLDDGRLLVGAVPLEVLEDAAMDPQAAA
ncbi:outer membrane lipoprotein-sorting protein [Haloactinopolyspora alba]|uniref:Outer membrane lipoprotein-sorting protein n=1 Tax=Haloactinopolyspora alba TaxID=648780 RepID=A0A2P8E2J9_9ACTN|nr:sigma-E factor regulatory protein RseB domain-containing protein [Haloactinopolyspora alba]PSL03698.1 outer membrane lipoprotein-sorting protein [Haloactinopolyspora alba]